MSKPLTIVVGGYIVAYPLGGMTWHHLNYLLGLKELGHDVWFLEDSGSYSYPYDPTTGRCGADSTYGRAYLERTLGEYGLPNQWCYYSEFENRHYGLNEAELNALLSRADLLLCVSGVTPVREHRPRARRMLVIDTDPVFTQLRMNQDAELLRYYRQFDAVATFGRLIGAEQCALPTHGFSWIPTHQPISLRHWPAAESPGNTFTTLGKWDHTSDRDFVFNGEKYRSSKGVEWMKVIDLPGKVTQPMAMAMLSMPASVEAQFRAAGWQLLDAQQASQSPRSYGDFIRASAGEFTVAKEIYAQIPSGWFSDRSAAYLASGRPVVTQATGFEHWLPTGEGLFSFADLEGACHALSLIAKDGALHRKAARRIAEEFFDARQVLSALLDHAIQSGRR